MANFAKNAVNPALALMGINPTTAKPQASAATPKNQPVTETKPKAVQTEEKVVQPEPKSVLQSQPLTVTPAVSAAPEAPAEENVKKPAKKTDKARIIFDTSVETKKKIYMDCKIENDLTITQWLEMAIAYTLKQEKAGKIQITKGGIVEL